MNIKTTLKASVAAAALFAVAMPTAEAGTISNGNDNSVTISGQISKGYLYVDDGVSSRSAIVDNDHSGSRFRILGSGKVNEAVSVGTALEVEFQDNASNNFQINDATPAVAGAGDNGFGQTSFTQRRMEAYISHKQFGKLSIGQGPTASDGTAETSMTGAGMAAYSGTNFWISSIVVRTQNEANNSFASGVTAGGTITNLDGGSRDDRIRYDSPTFAGFQVSGSAVSGGEGDVAVRYSGKFGGIAVKAAGSYLNTAGTSAANEGQWVISAAAEHDSGLNIRGNYGSREHKATARDDADIWNVTLGYKASLTSLGTTAFAVGYNQFENVEANDGEATMWEFGVNQHVKDAGAEFYLGGVLYEYELPNTNYEDIMAVMAGTRIKF